MRGRKRMNEQMRSGRTIVAEREWAETESDRANARKKAKRRKTTSVVIILLIFVVVGLIIYLGVREISGLGKPVESGPIEEKKPIQAEIIDEDGRGQITDRMREYIGNLEGDLVDLGYVMTKVVIPTGTSRELYVDLTDRGEYYKVNIDRDAAVTAEDIQRMIKYLDEHDLHPQYVDVRLDGKAYYK